MDRKSCELIYSPLDGTASQNHLVNVNVSNVVLLNKIINFKLMRDAGIWLDKT